MLVLQKMLLIANNHQDEAMAWLLIGAIFFAMRSCEYLESSNKQKQREKTLEKGNIVFKKGNKTIPHSSTQVGKADLVRIKFEFMKNQDMDIWVHMFKTS